MRNQATNQSTRSFNLGEPTSPFVPRNTRKSFTTQVAALFKSLGFDCHRTAVEQIIPRATFLSQSMRPNRRPHANSWEYNDLKGKLNEWVNSSSNQSHTLGDTRQAMASEILDNIRHQKTHLRIQGDIPVLAEVLCYAQHLTELTLSNMPSLEELPESRKHLTQLRHLTIYKCPKFKTSQPDVLALLPEGCKLTISSGQTHVLPAIPPLSNNTRQTTTPSTESPK